ncbi:hypothetical protein J0X19_15805 [Hymenobacter sp. BT186]|uniref:Uncharacterized protein n=1 Tax=Hymenobacter telluris TaxID=2816474 RepID=A0A939EX19_9BACT|nr:hypothetical protein [Hymenobacter telluris]MBW3375455.1 hypothetical protein [Hymenobacter norwichensis]
MLAKELKANLILLVIGVALMLVEVSLDYRDSTPGEIIEAVVLLPLLYLLVLLAPLRYLLLGVLWGVRQLVSATK